jgi:hypothetical protein
VESKLYISTVIADVGSRVYELEDDGSAVLLQDESGGTFDGATGCDQDSGVGVLLPLSDGRLLHAGQCYNLVNDEGNSLFSNEPQPVSVWNPVAKSWTPLVDGNDCVGPADAVTSALEAPGIGVVFGSTSANLQNRQWNNLPSGEQMGYLAVWNATAAGTGGYWGALVDANGNRGFDNLVNSLADWNGSLVAGGEFLNSWDSNTALSRVAVWRGFQTGWVQLGDDLNDRVFALAVMPTTGALFAGGAFGASTGSPALGSVAVLDEVNKVWKSLTDAQGQYAPSGITYSLLAVPAATGSSAMVVATGTYDGTLSNAQPGSTVSPYSVVAWHGNGTQGTWATTGSAPVGITGQPDQMASVLALPGTSFRGASLLAAGKAAHHSRTGFQPLGGLAFYDADGAPAAWSTWMRKPEWTKARCGVDMSDNDDQVRRMFAVTDVAAGGVDTLLLAGKFKGLNDDSGESAMQAAYWPAAGGTLQPPNFVLSEGGVVRGTPNNQNVLGVTGVLAIPGQAGKYWVAGQLGQTPGTNLDRAIGVWDTATGTVNNTIAPREGVPDRNGIKLGGDVRSMAYTTCCGYSGGLLIVGGDIVFKNASDSDSTVGTGVGGWNVAEDAWEMLTQAVPGGLWTGFGGRVNKVHVTADGLVIAAGAWIVISSSTGTNSVTNDLQQRGVGTYDLTARKFGFLNDTQTFAIGPKWNGNEVFAMAVTATDVYIAGTFTYMFTGYDLPDDVREFNLIARWDFAARTWNQLIDADTGAVGLAVPGSSVNPSVLFWDHSVQRLYAGMHPGTQLPQPDGREITGGVAEWIPSETRWYVTNVTNAAGVTSAIGPRDSGKSVLDIVRFQGRLVISGEFIEVPDVDDVNTNVKVNGVAAYY